MHDSYVFPEKQILNLAHDPPSERCLPPLDDTAGAPLTVEQAAALLALAERSPEHRARVLTLAETRTSQVFGNRMTIFAPLYVSNYCRNTCLYCNNSAMNDRQIRHRLTPEEFDAEVQALLVRGFTGIELVAGSDSTLGGNAVASLVHRARQLGIRSVLANVDAMEQSEYELLVEAGLSSLVLFQETYDSATYDRVHKPQTRKGDRIRRITAPDRAARAGIRHLGLGALLGLADWRWEFLSLVDHTTWLSDRYGCSISFCVPRMLPTDFTKDKMTPVAVSDQDLELLVAMLRLARPAAGIAISTRESREARRRLMAVGGTSTSADSSTSVGGYAEAHGDVGQFPATSISLTETIEDIIEIGKLPSFCTACSEDGVYGTDFEQFVRQSRLRQACELNALFSFARFVSQKGDSQPRWMDQILGHLNTMPLDAAQRDLSFATIRRVLEGGEGNYFSPVSGRIEALRQPDRMIGCREGNRESPRAERSG